MYIMMFAIFSCSYETGSHYGTQTGLAFGVFLPRPPKCWDYRTVRLGRAFLGVWQCLPAPTHWTSGGKHQRGVSYKNVSKHCQMSLRGKPSISVESPRLTEGKGCWSVVGGDETADVEVSRTKMNSVFNLFNNIPPTVVNKTQVYGSMP